MACNCGGTKKGSASKQGGAKVIKINGQVMRPKSSKKVTKIKAS